jgi:hypothetical protein
LKALPFYSESGQLVTSSGKLNVRSIITPWRGNSMNAAALRAAADKCRQSKGCVTTLTVGCETATWDRLVPFCATVSLSDKINQFTPFGEGATISGMMSAAACTITHGLYSL